MLISTGVQTRVTMGAVSLDEIDAEILARLQRDGRASGESIARKLDVSASTVRSRVEKLERAGVITGYRAGVDFGRAGFPIHVLLVCTAEGGLSAFGEEAAAADATAEGTSADVTGDASDEGGDDVDDGGVVEFTGTVVQAGDPVILDNGAETRSVETGANLRLGEEVTVRGVERDGTIDAEDVF